MDAYHIPVLLHESISGLEVKPGGDYVDATFGGGGHSREILNRLGNGRLFAFDQDADAADNLINDDRFFFIRHNFRFLKNFLAYFGVEKVDGILADLGVSSHDFNNAERGFSFRFNEKLDMRMNRNAQKNASEILNSYSETSLAKIFRNYGEIRNAGKLASAIVASRTKKTLLTTGQLKDAVKTCIPPKYENKYLAKVFQALRIEVNNELRALKELLLASLDVLKTGARVCIITYHSLEDRIVKNFFKAGNFEGIAEKDFYGNIQSPFRIVNNRVIRPSPDEVKNNPRARSAKLRIAEKI